MRAILALTAALLLAWPNPASAAPRAIADDGDRASLLEAVSRATDYLDAVQRTAVTLGDRQVPVAALRASAKRFRELVETAWGTPAFEIALRDEFVWVPMNGPDQPVHFTGYHLPLLEARKMPDATFRYPLYRAPDDVVRVDLGAFKPEWRGKTLLGRLDGGRLVPYYTRAEIDAGALKGRNLEIAWVSDDLDRYSLMVQGSGLLRFADGHVVNVNYGGQNGHPYTSLGKALIADGKIPQEKISMPAITDYFKAHPDEERGYLERNASYVFFRLAPEGPFGVSGMTLTPGRSIATDKRLFPSGAIAYLEYPRARFDASGAVAGWEEGSRFVVDQDTGGAITGAARVDIYWGGGEEAARRAGTLNGDGKAYYLLLRSASDGLGVTHETGAE